MCFINGLCLEHSCTNSSNTSTTGARLVDSKASTEDGVRIQGASSREAGAWLDPPEKPDLLENLVHLDQLEFLVTLDGQEMQEKKVLLDPLGLVENLEYQDNLGCQDFLERGDCQDCRYSFLI